MNAAMTTGEGSVRQRTRSSVVHDEVRDVATLTDDEGSGALSSTDRWEPAGETTHDEDDMEEFLPTKANKKLKQKSDKEKYDGPCAGERAPHSHGQEMLVAVDVVASRMVVWKDVRGINMEIVVRQGMFLCTMSMKGSRP